MKMFMKRLFSVLTAGIIVASSTCSLVANSSETNGFSQSEIDASPVKPKCFITVDDQKYGKV